MSPNEQVRGGGGIGSNVYTALLLLVLCVVVATAVFVAFKCYFQYDTIFKIP